MDNLGEFVGKFWGSCWEILRKLLGNCWKFIGKLLGNYWERGTMDRSNIVTEECILDVGINLPIHIQMKLFTTDLSDSKLKYNYSISLLLLE